MEQRRNARIVRAFACAAVALVASALIRRAAAAPDSPDPEREAFLDERRERMREARLRLLASTGSTAP
jgi:hypothetical protein